MPAPRPAEVGRTTRAVLMGTAANLALPLTALVTGPLLARAFGPAGRGDLAAIMGPLNVLFIAATLGMPEAATVFVASQRASPRGVLRLSTGPLLAVGAVVYSSWWWAVPHLVDDGDLVTVGRVAGLTLPLAMLIEVAQGTMYGSRRFVLTNLQTTAAAFLRLALLGALVGFGDLTIAWAVVISLVAPLGTGLSLLLAALRSGSRAHDPTVRRDFRRFALLGWPGSLATMTNRRLDQALMVPLVGDRQLGFYVVAVALAEAPSVFTTAVRSVLTAESVAADDMGMLARGSRATVLLVGSAVAGGLVLTPQVIRLLFGAAFEPSVGMARVLLVATLVGAASIGATSGLLAVGRPGIRSLAQTVSALTTVAGLLVLVPPLGAMGAAWTTLLATSIGFVIKQRAFSQATGLRPADLLAPRVDDIRWLTRELARVLGRAKAVAR
jgi:O-antigen/teichoic acid export membrane protein